MRLEPTRCAHSLLRMPLVSVILPTRDRPTLFGRAVASVLAQSEADLELILIDNNRQTAPLAQQREVQIWRTDRRVNMVRAADSPNAAAARNAGLAIARSEWIAFLDDDDAYLPEKLSQQLRRANEVNSPLVVCGARVHLHRRTRSVQTDTTEFKGDELLNRARWNTPLLLHRRVPGLYFDERLSAGEDGHYAQRLLAHWNADRVPNVNRPMVEIYQDEWTRSRTNLRADGGWQAARLTWRQYGGRFTPRARKIFVLRALMARAKLRGQVRQCVALVPPLLRAGGTDQIRFALNACLVAAGIGRSRLVT